MKKVTALCLLLACLFAGCGQKEALQETTPTQETIPTLTQAVTQTNEKKIIPIIQTVGGAPTVAPIQETENSIFRYEQSKYTICFAVDEKGYVYGVNYRHSGESGRVIKIYDWDGNCIEEHRLDITEKPTDLIVGEHYIYLLVPEADCEYVLYQIDKTTWEAKRLYDFTEFKDIWDMVLLGDTIYVLGEYENLKEKEFINYQDWYDRSNGNTYSVAYVHVNEETPKLAFVPFDLPMYIFAVNEDTLGIYGIEEHHKFRLFAYSPEDNTFQRISASYSTGEDFYRRPFQYYENGIFMVYDFQDIYYVSQDATEHEILLTDNLFYGRSRTKVGGRKMLYANGYLFYQEFNEPEIETNVIERVYIGDKLEEILQAE